MDCGAYFIIQIIIILREQELCLLIKYERQPNVALQRQTNVCTLSFHFINTQTRIFYELIWDI